MVSAVVLPTRCWIESAGVDLKVAPGRSIANLCGSGINDRPRQRGRVCVSKQSSRSVYIQPSCLCDNPCRLVGDGVRTRLAVLSRGSVSRFPLPSWRRYSERVRTVEANLIRLPSSARKSFCRQEYGGFVKRPCWISMQVIQSCKAIPNAALAVRCIVSLVPCIS